ncbi:hypothetical protein C2S52_003770 [Perilla frutescens var. hirtella]|nr:hypothetical protein C2S52_003770 [Perilla frutescens var. hirtella]
MLKSGETNENYKVMAIFPSTLFLIFLLTVAFSQSSCEEVISNVSLAGIVTCINASIVSVKTYPVIPGAQVDVVCGIPFIEKVMKSTTTNLAGIYSFSFNMADMILLNVPDLCHLNVAIPANSCLFDPSGGLLKFPIIGIRSSLGMLIDFIAGAPTYLLV